VDDDGTILALQSGRACGANKVRQRQHLAKHLRPTRHPLEREHEARQQHRRETEEQAPCIACTWLSAIAGEKAGFHSLGDAWADTIAAHGA